MCQKSMCKCRVLGKNCTTKLTQQHISYYSAFVLHCLVGRNKNICMHVPEDDAFLYTDSTEDYKSCLHIVANLYKSTSSAVHVVYSQK